MNEKQAIYDRFMFAWSSIFGVLLCSRLFRVWCLSVFADLQYSVFFCVRVSFMSDVFQCSQIFCIQCSSVFKDPHANIDFLETYILMSPRQCWNMYTTPGRLNAWWSTTPGRLSAWWSHGKDFVYYESHMLDENWTLIYGHQLLQHVAHCATINTASCINRVLLYL